MKQYIMALDQGTTSSRTIIFDHNANIKSVAQKEFEQIFPSPGHVEHDPEAIWTTQFETASEALKKAGLTGSDIAAIGITNQRETIILWDKATGKPVHNAIVWQSRISAPICDRMKAEGLEIPVRQKTGLLLDPYFSATKIRYLLDLIPGLQGRAEKGEILAGTVDTWLLWKLTGGKVHATDPGNASRTLLFNIHSLDWDEELLRIFGVPRVMLPEVRATSGSFGETDVRIFGRPIHITGIAGDQQAATFGQCCFEAGMAKNTYGTGCFLMMNTGEKPVVSSQGLLTTIGWRIGEKTVYCLEGSVFMAGATVQWLRDGLKMIKNSAEIEALAGSVADSGGVYLVPAFTGLGAPHWDPYARGAILGLTRGTTQAHIARAAVESMAFQTFEVVEAMARDAGIRLPILKVDGGASVNNALLQFQADLLDCRVERPVLKETTALGAAFFAGLAVGFWNGTADLAKRWQQDRIFEPRMDAQQRNKRVGMWRKAVERAKGWSPPDTP